MRHDEKRRLTAPIREFIFWIAAALFAAFVILFDYNRLFVYIPKWAVLPPLLLIFPARVNRTYWWRLSVVVLLAALPFILAPVRWHELKGFFIDCGNLEQGMKFDAALAAMSRYETSIPDWMVSANMYGVPETRAEKSSRVIIIPSLERDADWCVLYREGETLTRVEIHPD